MLAKWICCLKSISNMYFAFNGKSRRIPFGKYWIGGKPPGVSFKTSFIFFTYMMNENYTRDVFKLVRNFSVAPYKPSDSAQKFDGPLNLASQVREAESLNKKQKQWYYLDSQFITWPLSHVRPDLEVHQISVQNHSVCTELRKSLVLIWKRL